ncbi:hypothetical protein [Risungbinella massiliensis]|uniref:hypothetical protein n=1 Tax=Risungbinella massiliensis TaxID=1329796 RepID=UPI0005CB925B|nr:hypothetical protein [Risungbinella massiliensis]
MEFRPNYHLSFEEMRKERWTSIEGFLKGIKPACYESIERISDEHLQELQSYPHLDNGREVIYFQSADLLQTFEGKVKYLEKGSPDWVAVLGETLGYPPKAVQYYTEHWKRHLVDQEAERIYHQNHHIGMKYAGIQSASHIQDLIENVHWFWNTYQYPISLWVMVYYAKEDIGADFRIRYRNEQELIEVNKTVIAILEQNKQSIVEKEAIALG